MTIYGQYSVVSYMHSLRGEKINLGVIVWHSIFGFDLKFTKSLQRLRCIDEMADLDRVKNDLQTIEDTMKNWSSLDSSPLEFLASKYKFGLSVAAPMNARIQDPAFTLEKLYATLIQPEPFQRASSSIQFSNSIASKVTQILEQNGGKNIRKNYTETETFQPIRITIEYQYDAMHFVWRAASFASSNALEDQLRLAKSFYAENLDLIRLEKYWNAHFCFAVQLPKPQLRKDWQKPLDWLKRSMTVEEFEDRNSLDEKLPELVLSQLSSMPSMN